MPFVDEPLLSVAADFNDGDDDDDGELFFLLLRSSSSFLVDDDREGEATAETETVVGCDRLVGLDENAAEAAEGTG